MECDAWAGGEPFCGGRADGVGTDGMAPAVPGEGLEGVAVGRTPLEGVSRFIPPRVLGRERMLPSTPPRSLKREPRASELPALLFEDAIGALRRFRIKI
jgi:hypothetical protein